MKYFTKAKWIWHSHQYDEDEYATFIDSIEVNDLSKKSSIILSCDSNFAIYVNDVLAGFNQYPDYPSYKIYEKVNISKFLKKGNNKIMIIVNYYGVPTQTYFVSNPGLMYEIRVNNKVVSYSSEHTMCSIDNHYLSHYKKLITKQIGYSFLYNANNDKELDYQKSVLVDKKAILYPRPIKPLKLMPRHKIKVINTGVSYLIDFKEEICGFVDIEINSSCANNKLLITYGENLENGHVRRHPQDIMDYSVEYVAKEGYNNYLNPFRRIAGCYLEVYSDNPIKIKYVGIRPVIYPLTRHLDVELNEKRKQIYRVAGNTLSNCMHDHFEDCPWREQALYTMDSRNEMICAYHLFKDYKFARSNLVLMSYGLRDDNLLTLCYPTTLDSPIPFFSLVYPIQILEYIEYSKDESILDETFDVVQRIMTNFVKHIDKTGIIKNWETPTYWNFYEWTDGSVINPGEQYDAILNLMFIYSYRHYEKLCSIRGIKADFEISNFTQSVYQSFFNKERKVFFLSNNNQNSSQLVNSIASLAGFDDCIDWDYVLNSDKVIPITLSMSVFLYDALLKKDEEYKNYILNDIDTKFGYMVDQGATTFWETLKGAEDIGGSGSLCHGWSSIPIYYYSTLLK